ncbi:MAG: 2-dehydropantoate 2-reductase [Pseudomonadota bacterium]
MITVFGAGSIGCYVGGMLAAAGRPVTLIGRDAMMTALGEGVTATALDGTQCHAKPFVTTNPEDLAGSSMVLVCVKSNDTSAAVQILRRHAPPDARIISLQNGLTNADTLSDVLGPDRITAGMVGFNVVQQGPSEFAQTTQGDIVLDPSGSDLARHLGATPITARTHRNIEGVLWSKLLLNLNNPLNALSGIGLRAQLESRDWRLVLAACISEGLAVARAENVHLEKLGRIHPKSLPVILSLPNFVFGRIAQSMLHISPTARSSMADDYARSRPSEVNWLNAHIMRCAEAHGLKAPTNTRVVHAINEAFASDDRPPLALSPRSFLPRKSAPSS